MYVYLITDEINYKIGSSKNVEQRLKQLQTSNANKLRIIETIRSYDYKRLELLLHKRFKNKKLSGEWFELNNNDLNNFIGIANNLNNYIKQVNEI